MARHGGAASWLFLPYISCGQVIPRHRLHGLDQKIIGLHPSSLNRMRHSGPLYKAVPNCLWGSKLLCVRVRQTMCRLDDTSQAIAGWRCECRQLMLMELCCLLPLISIQQLLCILHYYYCMLALILPLDRPWSITQSIRRFGGSVVVLYDGEGNSFVGLLKAAVKTAREWGMGHRYLGMIQRQDHETNRPEDYDYLLALCRSEIPKSEACDLLVQ